MSLILLISKIYTPNFIKKIILKKLYQLTAKAFDSELPYIKKLNYTELLRYYAIFAKVQCTKVLIDSEKIGMIKQNLYAYAYTEGVKLRRLLNIATMKDTIAIIQLFYSIIKIDFKTVMENEVRIKQCFFADYFSPDICRIMCSLDEGIIAGLSNGYVLNFSQRITENYDCCKAELVQ